VVSEHYRQLLLEHQHFFIEEEARFSADKRAACAAAREAALELLIQKADEALAEARSRNLLYFACDLRVSAPAMPIFMRFADATKTYIFTRQVTVGSFFRKLNVSFTLGNASVLKQAVQSHVLHVAGIKPLSSLSRRRKKR
jgi:hypothetical protein